MDIVEKYGATKSSIYEWLRNYGKECPNTTGNKENSESKEIRELNLKIKELEKENAFLKKPRHSLRKKSISGISVH